MIQYGSYILKVVPNLNDQLAELSLLDREKLNIQSFKEETEYHQWTTLFYIYRGESLVGFISCYCDLLNRTGDINKIWIRPEYRGSLAAAHSSLLGLYYLFELRGMQKVESVVFGFNEESYRLQKKFFNLEGECKSSCLFRGERYSRYYFGITRAELYSRSEFKKRLSKIVVT